MGRRSNEPFLWALFSAGGVVTAFLLPVLILLFGLAFPLGWLEPPSYHVILPLVRPPVVRFLLFLFCTLSFFHWAHRFRFTLSDALKIKHLAEEINALCYGGAVLGTVLAAYVLWNAP